MAWTAPRTWVAGELVTVGMFNQQLTANHTVLRLPWDSTGKLVAISSTYVSNLSGASLTGVAVLAAGAAYTGGRWNFGSGSTGRLVIPYGADKWAT